MFSNKKMIIISKSKRKFLRQFFLLKLLDFAYSISFVIMHHDCYLHSWIPCIINMGTENRSTLVGVPEVKFDKKLRILTVSIVVAPDRSLEWAQICDTNGAICDTNQRSVHIAFWLHIKDVKTVIHL